MSENKTRTEEETRNNLFGIEESLGTIPEDINEDDIVDDVEDVEDDVE